MRRGSATGIEMAGDYKTPSFFRTASPDRYELLKGFAKENREHPTEAEACLWQLLKGGALGVKFRRQYVVYDYIADFICLEKNLIIEVDGGINEMTGKMCKDLGATSLVSGSYIYHSKDIKKAIISLR